MCPSVHCEIAVREIERRETTNVCGGQQQEMESGDPELESESGDRRGAQATQRTGGLGPHECECHVSSVSLFTVCVSVMCVYGTPLSLSLSLYDLLEGRAPNKEQARLPCAKHFLEIGGRHLDLLAAPSTVGLRQTE